MKGRLKRLYWKITTKQLDGVGIIEVILILVIIIGLVYIFREQISQIIDAAWDAITADTDTINTTELDIQNKK